MAYDQMMAEIIEAACVFPVRALGPSGRSHQRCRGTRVIDDN